jgi:hypothetical protein
MYLGLGVRKPNDMAPSIFGISKRKNFMVSKGIN